MTQFPQTKHNSESREQSWCLNFQCRNYSRLLSFSAEDRCFKNNLHCFRFIFQISVECSFIFCKWNEYNVILEINPVIEIMLGEKNSNLLFARAMNSNIKIANFSKINRKSSTSWFFCLKDQFWTSDFPQSMQKEHIFKIIVHYGCTNTLTFNRSLGTQVIKDTAKMQCVVERYLVASSQWLTVGNTGMEHKSH